MSDPPNVKYPNSSPLRHSLLQQTSACSALPTKTQGTSRRRPHTTAWLRALLFRWPDRPPIDHWRSCCTWTAAKRKLDDTSKKRSQRGRVAAIRQLSILAASFSTTGLNSKPLAPTMRRPNTFARDSQDALLRRRLKRPTIARGDNNDLDEPRNMFVHLPGAARLQSPGSRSRPHT